MDRYVFADEAGNFAFSNRSGASRYFILCTVSLTNCVVGDELLDLRRTLGWQGIHLDAVFHASEDPQAVRDEVFGLLKGADFRIDATIFEKSKTRPHLQNDRDLYKISWFLHFKHVAPQIVSVQDRLFVVASSLGTKKRRARFTQPSTTLCARSRRATATELRSGRQRATPACRSPTTARGQSSASGSARTRARTT